MNLLWNRILTAFLTTLVVTALAAVIFTIIKPANRGYTEFYLLDHSGGVNEYPEEVYTGDNVSLISVVVNQELREADYQLIVKLSDNETIRTENLSLAPGEKWQNTISFVPKVATPEEKVEFLLFIDGQSEPYRKLHLWLNVKSSTP